MLNYKFESGREEEMNTLEKLISQTISFKQISKQINSVWDVYQILF